VTKRVFLVVIDSLGIGAMPDADRFGDGGSNTLSSIRKSTFFSCPTLASLGLLHIDGVEGGGREKPIGAFARMTEQSAGKDTTVGHWEIAGCTTDTALPTYPNGFPRQIVEALEKRTGRRVLCNRPYSGTEVIRDFGPEHIRTGDWIVYTSADSVLQIAAHEDTVPVEELYRCCEIAREIMTGEHGVGRIIARPFAGEYPFVRTSRRHDYSLPAPRTTALDILSRKGLCVIGVGKISDIFAGRGVSESYPTRDNAHGMSVMKEQLARDFEGLCFVNFVDFDMKYGHRNDIDGYARAMSELDVFLKDALSQLKDGDLLMITGDHGCDPATPSTDHSREYTPLLVYGKTVVAGKNLGTRTSFADIGATLLDYFGLPHTDIRGNSFLSDVCDASKSL